jgi:hypothetical protein
VSTQTIVQQIARRDGDRLRAYRECLDFYQGMQWQGSRRRRERKLVFNYAKAFVDKVTSYLMTGLNFAVEAEEDSAEGRARPQLVKMLTCNDLSVFRRVRALLPNAKVVTRLFWAGRPPEPQAFCAEMAPVMQEILALGGDTFELLNEPNTPWEGFGPDGAAEFD